MKIERLSLQFGAQEIFNDVNISIKDNEKVGIVGVNGAGKTTLFKLIMGQLEPDEGRIIINNKSRVQLLPQVINDEVPSMDISVLDFLLSGRPIKKLERELQETYEMIGATNVLSKQEYLFKKSDKLQSLLEYWNYTSAETELLKIIYGMDIDNELLERKLSELSGGQKSKVAFAKLLYSKPEIVLLDEPTNHLDFQTKEFVINYLKNYKGSVFVISHDIEFLNKIITSTLFLDKRTKKFELYNGNYDLFLKLQKEKEETINKLALKQEKEMQELQNIISKYSSSSGKRKRMAQDREKKLEKLLENKIDIIREQKNAKITMEVERESTKIPLKVNNLYFRYNKNSNMFVIDNLSFELYKGEKFLIVGENGVGKSTLLKLIVNQLIPESGEIILGNKTDIGYYAQEHELLDNNKTILDNFQNTNLSINQIRKVLGRFLFYGNDVYKKVKVLSPGERSRVALAKLSITGANFLILDEPTNHLDPETQKIIADTFKTFNGTMLIVSHNPEFVDNLGVERVLILPEGNISYYDKKTVENYNKIYKKSKL